MGIPVEGHREAYEEISPLGNLTADCPPVLIFHGDHDNIVHMENAVRFKEKADQIGADCTLKIVHNAGHGFSNQGPAPNDPSTKKSADFFVKHLTHL
jgi:dipeptidyl aminopeptidase/acylaminoacyl peptidase